MEIAAAIKPKFSIVDAPPEIVRLNLCSGSQKVPGYTNLDAKLGLAVYPLNYDDDSVDEIRCSHGLEHFPLNSVRAVLKDWVRALKPGGTLKIAVPNFRWICEQYLQGGSDDKLASYVLGGQQDEHDFHKALFDESSLTWFLTDAGLSDIRPWTSEIQDCATNPVSLNLMGTKGAPQARPDTLEVNARTIALMSVPRLGFQDNFGSCFAALRHPNFEIPLWLYGGAFWEMGIQNGLNEAVKQGVQWVITIDYDTLFDKEDINELLTLAAMYPEADAIVPVQSKRNTDAALFTMKDAYGKLVHRATYDDFDKDLTPIHTGHFGLTLLKMDAVQKLQKPWFHTLPAPDGDYGEGRTDADIYFWQRAEKQGFRAFQANNIRIGHIQMVASWINRDFQSVHQYLSNYREFGKPEF